MRKAKAETSIMRYLEKEEKEMLEVIGDYAPEKSHSAYTFGFWRGARAAHEWMLRREE